MGTYYDVEYTRIPIGRPLRKIPYGEIDCGVSVVPEVDQKCLQEYIESEGSNRYPFWIELRDNGVDGDGIQIKISTDLKKPGYNGEMLFWTVLEETQARIIHEALGSILRCRELQKKEVGEED